MNQRERELFFNGDDKGLSELTKQEELSDLFIQLLNIFETSNITLTGSPVDKNYISAIEIIQKGLKEKREF